MTKRWYSVHVLSNFEKKVAESIREGAAQHGLEDEIEDVLVPTEEVTEVRRGQKVNVEKRFMPGYVLVKMEMTDRAYHLVKNTQRVTGFLGPMGKPIPLRDREVAQLLNQVEEGLERPRPAITFDVGEQVKVTDGPFDGFTGMVEEVDEASARLKVSVSIFRPRDAGRAGIRPGRERDLTVHPWEARASRRPDRTTLMQRPGRVRGRRKGRERMAKKVMGSLKLQVPAGKANPSPPIGPALGQRGLNIMEFCKQFNAKSQGIEPGSPCPTIITYYQDKSFTFEIKTPPASFLIKKAANLKSGSQTPGRSTAGTITVAQVREIAETKMKDLNANDIEQAMKIILGSAKSMGVEVR